MAKKESLLYIGIFYLCFLCQCSYSSEMINLIDVVIDKNKVAHSDYLDKQTDIYHYHNNNRIYSRIGNNESAIIQIKRAIKIIITIYTLVVLFLFIVILIMYSKLKLLRINKTFTEQNIISLNLINSELKDENKLLKDSISEYNSTNIKMKEYIRHRENLLDRICLSEITNNIKLSRKVYQELDSYIQDKETFIHSVALYYEIIHPELISLLKEKQLTKNEIEYCCLYALGMTGKDIGQYTSYSRHYKISSDIRKKMGIGESETNINLYIQKFLTKT